MMDGRREACWIVEGTKRWKKQGGRKLRQRYVGAGCSAQDKPRRSFVSRLLPAPLLLSVWLVVVSFVVAFCSPLLPA